ISGNVLDILAAKHQASNVPNRIPTLNIQQNTEEKTTLHQIENKNDTSSYVDTPRVLEDEESHLNLKLPVPQQTPTTAADPLPLYLHESVVSSLQYQQERH